MEIEVHYKHEFRKYEKIRFPSHLQHCKKIQCPYAPKIFENCLQNKLPAKIDEWLLPQYINCCKHFKLPFEMYEREFLNQLHNLRTPRAALLFFLPHAKTSQALQTFTDSFLDSEHIT